VTEGDTDTASASQTSPLDIANGRIREAAKWLVASAAAVGAAMLAGSQLSSIGELDIGWPTSVEHARFWVALLGAVAGLGAVVYAIWTAVQIMLPKLVLISELAQAWDTETGPLAPVVRQFKRNTKYLQGFDTPAEVIEARQDLIAKQHDPKTDENTKATLPGRIGRLDERIMAIEDTAVHEALKAAFSQTLRKLLASTTVAAVGIVAFAWAANPPKETPTADLRGARLVNAFLRDADLRNAKLDNTDLTGADLTGANLDGASLNGVTWRNTTCPDGTNSDADRGTCAGHRK
jgi:hypothetical protein